MRRAFALLLRRPRSRSSPRAAAPSLTWRRPPATRTLGKQYFIERHDRPARAATRSPPQAPGDVGPNLDYAFGPDRCQGFPVDDPGRRPRPDRLRRPDPGRLAAEQHQARRGMPGRASLTARRRRTSPPTSPRSPGSPTGPGSTGTARPAPTSASASSPGRRGRARRAGCSLPPPPGGRLEIDDHVAHRAARSARARR